MSKLTKALREWEDKLHPADRQFKADLSTAADALERAEAQLRVARRKIRLLRDEMSVQVTAWRHAAEGKTPGGFPTGKNYCKSMSRAAQHALDVTDGRKIARRKL